MDHAGAVAGPLVAAGLLMLPGFTLRRVFLLAAIPAAIVVVILLVGVHEPGRSRPAPDAEPVRIAMWGDLGGPFKRLLVALVIFTLGNSTDAFILLRLTDAGFAAGWVAVLWSLHSLVKLGANLYGGQLSDRVGRKPLIVAGWSVYALVYLGFGVTTSAPALVALFLAYGIYFGLTEPVERAWVAALAPAGRSGSAFGFYHGAIGLVALPASLLFGLVYETVGPEAAFGLGSILAVSAAVLLLGVPSEA